MNKKKLIIIGTAGTGALVGAIVIPIVVINSNNDKKNKEDVVAVIKILKEKSISERTLELASDSNGKIIASNKEEVIKKVKELIGTSKLREVLIDVTMTTDANVLIVEQAIIVTIKKGDHSQKLEGKNGLKVKRALTTIEQTNADINAIKAILDAKTENDLMISLPSSSTSNIIGENKEAIESELRKLIDSSNTDGAIDHVSLKGTTITVSMTTDSPISTTLQDIIVTISKTGGISTTTSAAFQVKRLKTSAEITNEDIEAIKAILDAKTGNDLMISLPNTATGNIIGENKEAIESELRKLIDSSNTNGANKNHLSLKGTTITVSITSDSPISTTPQDIIVTISKTGGISTTTSAAFRVVRPKTNAEITNEDIGPIKTILDAKTGTDLMISLPSSSTSNIIGENKEAIESELRKLIDSSNTDGAIDHVSLKGTTITVSMTTDSPISTTPQDIIVTISKTGGTPTTTSAAFQVKRLKTSAEITDEDIEAIKTILDAKTTRDLIIILPSSSTGNIIGENKEAIESELRKLIDSSNTNGANKNHSSLKGTTITVSITSDSPISTTLQEIIVTISKTGGTSTTTSAAFRVVRPKTNAEIADEDIEAIKAILDAKTGNDLMISLPGSSTGNIIGENKEAIESELRKLIDSSNTNGANKNHSSLKGTTITISITSDSPISTTLQEIIVTISKTGGTSTTTSAAFQVKRLKTNAEITDEDIGPIKTILDAKTGNDLMISLPSSSTGNIIGENKEAIESELRKLIDSSNTDGAIDHVSLKGTTITVSMTSDSPISTTLQEIIVTISKTGGTSAITSVAFRVVRPKTSAEIADETIKVIKNILDAKTGTDLMISLPSSSTGNIIRDNKEAIESELRKLIDSSNDDGAIDHSSLKGTTITVSMTNDGAISTTPQEIIVTISKTGGISTPTSKLFTVLKS